MSYWKRLSFRIECDLKAELTEQLSNRKLLARILVLEVRGTCGLSVDFSFVVCKHASIGFEVLTVVLQKIAH